MIPFGSETVTLVQRTETSANGKTQAHYSTVILTGCSWQRKARMVRDGNALVSSEDITCRVPADQAKPKHGDLLILGSVDVSVTSGSQYQQLIEQYKDTNGAFVVGSVKDNARRGVPIPHYAARS